MSEDLAIVRGGKEEQYRSIIPQIEALLEGEGNLIANMVNITAALKEQFRWWWIGFYLVEKDELVLGPFQGPIACTRIKKGKGVCGTAWQKAETLIVPDVNQFPGHIACSSFSKSEIVVPVIRNGEVKAVLDIDSEYYSHFDEVDKENLLAILDLLKVGASQTFRFIVHGKVQGVFFRKSTRDTALALGLTGYVKNLPDGDSVEIVATGSADFLACLYQWCQIGPPKAIVQSVSKEVLPNLVFEDFEII